MKELTLEITNKCNQSCPWCSSNSIPNGYIINRTTILDLLKKYRRECNVVRFSGGEPTLHPSLQDFLFYAKQLDYKVILLTNGLHLSSLYSKLEHYVDEYWLNVVSSKSLLEAWY